MLEVAKKLLVKEFILLACILDGVNLVEGAQLREYVALLVVRFLSDAAHREHYTFAECFGSIDGR